jgi:putative transposase
MKSYYITLTVVGWIDVFTRKEYAYSFLNTIKYWQRKKELRLRAFVIMSNRVHLIIDIPDEDLNGFLLDFKHYSANQITNLIMKNENEGRCDWLMHMLSYFGKYSKENSNVQFWQKDDQNIELRREDQIAEKIDFLHQRPVVHGIVFQPEHYIYSSANPNNQISLIIPRETHAYVKKIVFS